jgi:hypothetical protein
MENLKHKVFVSYKYSDAVDTRDRIMTKLGNSGHFYKGEKGYKALEYADDTLKKYLGDMIYDSSVTIVVISPEVVQSKWVDWEIRHSLENQTRNDRTSGRNGILCVIQSRDDYSTIHYDPVSGNVVCSKNSRWAYNQFGSNSDLKGSYLPQVIRENMAESFPNVYSSYRGYLAEDESNTNHKDFCVVVAESTFLADPDRYINVAFERAHNPDLVTKTRF